MTLFENSFHLFRKVNVEKKFSRFTFYEIDSPKDFWLYIEKDMVVKYDGKFYQYKGETVWNSSVSVPSEIRVKDGKNQIFSLKH